VELCAAFVSLFFFVLVRVGSRCDSTVSVLMGVAASFFCSSLNVLTPREKLDIQAEDAQIRAAYVVDAHNPDVHTMLVNILREEQRMRRGETTGGGGEFRLPTRDAVKAEEDDDEYAEFVHNLAMNGMDNELPQ